MNIRSPSISSTPHHPHPHHRLLYKQLFSFPHTHPSLISPLQPLTRNGEPQEKPSSLTFIQPMLVKEKKNGNLHPKVYQPRTATRAVRCGGDWERSRTGHVFISHAYQSLQLFFFHLSDLFSIISVQHALQEPLICLLGGSLFHTSDNINI